MAEGDAHRPAIVAGEAEDRARIAVILLHGRGQTATFMLDTIERLPATRATFRALSAPGDSWYPQSFLAPIDANQPWLDAALDHVDEQVRLLEAGGWTRDRIVIIGFSQGACLACDYVLRRPARWGGLIAFTGGLIGAPGAEWAAQPALCGTPVLLTNGDADPWVPWSRIEETAAVFARSGAQVAIRRYDGRDHSICDDEIDLAADLLAKAGRTTGLANPAHADYRAEQHAGL